MSQLHARLFEKWLDAGDDRTFSEWLTYRRECATQARQHRALMRGLSPLAPPGLQAQASFAWQQRMAGMQQSQLQGIVGQALGGLGGIFR